MRACHAQLYRQKLVPSPLHPSSTLHRQQSRRFTRSRMRPRVSDFCLCLKARHWLTNGAETLPSVIYCMLKIPSYPTMEIAHCRPVFTPLRSRDPQLAARVQYIAKRLSDPLAAQTYLARCFSWSTVRSSLFQNPFLLLKGTLSHPIGVIRSDSREQNCVLSFPIGSTALKLPSAVILNSLGSRAMYPS